MIDSRGNSNEDIKKGLFLDRLMGIDLPRGAKANPSSGRTSRIDQACSRLFVGAIMRESFSRSSSQLPQGGTFVAHTAAAATPIVHPPIRDGKGVPHTPWC